MVEYKKPICKTIQFSPEYCCQTYLITSGNIGVEPDGEADDYGFEEG